MEGFVGFLIAIGIIYGLLMWARAIDHRALQENGQTGENGFDGHGEGIAGSMLKGARHSYQQNRARAELDIRSAKYEVLEKLKSLHDRGAISDQEYEAEKSAVLGRDTA